MIETSTSIFVTPRSLEIYTDLEVARATTALVLAAEHALYTDDEVLQLGERMLAITQLVAASPKRVLADTGKLPERRTEYDKDRAHFIAATIDPEMTYIANDKQKRGPNGKFNLNGKRSRAELSVHFLTKAASDVYDSDPILANRLNVNDLRLANPDMQPRRGRLPFQEKVARELICDGSPSISTEKQRSIEPLFDMITK